MNFAAGPNLENVAQTEFGTGNVDWSFLPREHNTFIVSYAVKNGWKDQAETPKEAYPIYIIKYLKTDSLFAD